jgi:hypothetical protein
MPIKAPILNIRLDTMCRSKKTLGAQSGFMLAILLAVLGLMLVTGVVLSRLMTTSQLTNQLQQAQRGQQQMQTLIGALAAGASDGDGDHTLEPPAAISNGVPPSFGNTKDVFGTAFRYCSYDYGTTNSSSGRIAGNKTNLSSSWIAIALISAGPDRVFQTTSCPATDTDVANATALGDDSILTRSYADLGSFGNKTYADKLNAGFGTNKLCRVNAGSFVCNQELPSVTCTGTQRLVFDEGKYICRDFVEAVTCAANQWQRWNASTKKFECQTIVNSGACGWTNSFMNAGVMVPGIPQGVRWNSGNWLECYNPIGATGDQGNQGPKGKDMKRCKDYSGLQHNPGTGWWEADYCSWHTCASNGSGTVSWTDNNVCDGCGMQAGQNRSSGDNWTVTCPAPATTSTTYYCYDGTVHKWSGTGKCP